MPKGAERRPVAAITLSGLLLVGFGAAAALTGAWALTAAPLGFLLGFLLAKGDLCSASAFSEVLLFRDGRKLAGLWVAAVAAMLAFAGLSELGLVELCPRPLYWASYLVGGLVFGVGMVLAGGCVSGSLYKCGAGHLNSLLALLAIPVGIQLVDFGPLSDIDRALRERVIQAPGGGPLTLGSVTGIPYLPLALAIAGATAGLGLLLSRRRRAPAGAAPRSVSLADRFLRRPWRPWKAGAVLGLLAAPVWLSSLESGRDFPICVTYGVEEAPLLLTEPGADVIWDRGDILESERRASFEAGERPAKRIYVWLVLFALGVIPGSYVASRLMGRSGLKRRPRGELLIAIPGGLLLGVGAAFGWGCVLGNGVMGAALQSVGMVFFAVAACLANWVTSRLYLLPLRSGPPRRRGE